MIPYQWTSAAVAILIAAAMVWLVRRNRLGPRLAAWWLVLAVAIAVIGALPGIVDRLAAHLGVTYSPTLIVLLGMAVLLIKLLKSDIDRSRNESELRILAQKVAVLEAEAESRTEANGGKPRGAEPPCPEQ